MSSLNQKKVSLRNKPLLDVNIRPITIKRAKVDPGVCA